jgi:UDP-N-acetylglucosamine--N-acetylmuramyl-(pentapeptide) pyrophosphoryl-undecaprenol N-acetylglucosamine transferase
MLKDEDCTGRRLAEVLNELLAEPAHLTQMAEAAAALGRPDAADAVASLVQAHAR